jgi:hypothetical protein
LFFTFVINLSRPILLVNSPKPANSGPLFAASMAVVFALSSIQAATPLMNMTFNNGGSQINEVTGWNGTTAPGGSLDSALSVVSGMKIFGDFVAGPQPDVFHVDNWQNTNTTDTRVGLTLGVSPLYFLNLGNGDAQFSTKLHQHPQNQTDVFDTVTLSINGLMIGEQAYTPGGGPQTLTWNVAANSNLNNLSSASFDLYFTSSTNQVANNAQHGPEWSLADGAFVAFSGDIIAVPEPSRSLVSLGGLMVLALRRRRKSSHSQRAL